MQTRLIPQRKQCKLESGKVLLIFCCIQGNAGSRAVAGSGRTTPGGRKLKYNVDTDIYHLLIAFCRGIHFE